MGQGRPSSREPKEIATTMDLVDATDEAQLVAGAGARSLVATAKSVSHGGVEPDD